MRWDEIAGQDRAVRLLRGALETERVHHAYLLAGPEGVGKELLALCFAQAANCEALLPDRPCGKCAHCAGIARGNFPDVMWVMPQAELIARGKISKADLEAAPSKEIRVDEIRALEEQGGRGEFLRDVERALSAGDERDALDLAERYGERDAALGVARAVHAWTRDLLVAQAGAPAQALESRELAPLAKEVATRVAAVQLLQQASLCSEVVEALEQNGNGRLQLERLLLGARELRP